MNANFRSLMNRRIRNSQAQGMTEYILVVTLVAIACITAVTALGQKVARLFVAATQSLDVGTPVASAPSDVNKVNTSFTLGSMGEADGGQGAGD